MDCLEEIIKIARARKNTLPLSVLNKYDLTEEEYLDIISNLKSNGITIFDEEDLDYEVLNSEVKAFIKDASKYPVLTKEEEIDLFNKYKNGDNSAKEKIINSNLRLVIHVAKNLANSKPYLKSVPFVDLIQEGCLGLIKAVDRYDVNRGFKFSTQAYWWIMSFIVRMKYCISDDIYLPDNLRYKLRKVQTYINLISDCEGKKITIEQACEMLGYNKEQIMSAVTLFNNLIRLDENVNDDDDLTFSDFLGGNANVEEEVLDKAFYEEVDKVLHKCLTKKEYNILKLRIEEGLTLQSVANQYNVTRERIRQIEQKAKVKGKKRLRFLGYSDEES